MDEYQGLPAAFLVGGAQTVVGSLWAVDDLATAFLSRRFHRNLYRNGMTKAGALREAQLWLRDATSEELDAILAASQGRGRESGQPRLREAMSLARARLSALSAAEGRFKLAELPGLTLDRPFSHPYYWAAFQCVGVGW